MAHYRCNIKKVIQAQHVARGWLSQQKVKDLKNLAEKLQLACLQVPDLPDFDMDFLL